MHVLIFDLAFSTIVQRRVHATLANRAKWSVHSSNVYKPPTFLIPLGQVPHVLAYVKLTLPICYHTYYSYITDTHYCLYAYELLLYNILLIRYSINYLG